MVRWSFFKLVKFVIFKFWTMRSVMTKLLNPPKRFLYFSKLFSHTVTKSNPKDYPRLIGDFITICWLVDIILSYFLGLSGQTFSAIPVKVTLSHDILPIFIIIYYSFIYIYIYIYWRIQCHINYRFLLIHKIYHF